MTLHGPAGHGMAEATPCPDFTAVQDVRCGPDPPSEGILGTVFEHGAAFFISLAAGVQLALWPRTSYAAEMAVPMSPTSPTGLTLGHNVANRQEVDKVATEATEATAVGPTIIDLAQDWTRDEYSWIVQYPDGYLWERARNPFAANRVSDHLRTARTLGVHGQVAWVKSSQHATSWNVAG